MKVGMINIAFIGGGSPYVPVIVHGLCSSMEYNCIKKIVLYDIDILRLEIISKYCDALIKKFGFEIEISITNVWDSNLDDLDLFINIFRVGGMESRHYDELIGKENNIIGQETQGYGGFASALRNINLLKTIAPKIKKGSPNALFLNVTNPSGIMTGAALKLGLNAVGICDVPYGMKKQVAIFANTTAEQLKVSYIGLNHLGWIIDIEQGGKSIFDSFLNSNNLSNLLALLKQNNIPFPADCKELVKAINALPSSYLTYYYYRDKIIEYQRQEQKTRAQKLIGVNEEIFNFYSSLNLREWPDFIVEKRGAFLLGEAVAKFILNKFCFGINTDHIICQRNGNTISWLEEDSIIETNVLINNSGNIIPQKIEIPICDHIKSLMQMVSAYENLTIDAGINMDKEKMLEALVTHPLVTTFELSKTLVDKTLQIHSKYLYNNGLYY